MDEKETGRQVKMIVPVGPLLLLALIGFLVWRRSRQKEERGWRRVLQAVERSDLPDQARDALTDAVAQVRAAVAARR